MRYYLGLDNGGTNTKAALFDMNGMLRGVASRTTGAINPAPGVVERDMDELSASIVWEYVEEDIKSWADFIKAHIRVIWLRYPENNAHQLIRK